MKKELIFVTGYFGSPIKQLAEKIAAKKNYELLSLDNEIEKSDGRSVLRICMIMGEHEYRNKEYEMLSKLTSENRTTDANGTVVYCGDGVLHDEMSKEIIKNHSLFIAGTDMSMEELWSNAKDIKDSPHAFMHFDTDENKLKKFKELYERQHLLFASFENNQEV